MSATNRGAERRENDFYETPAWCVDALLEANAGTRLDPRNWPTVLDPCCGDGAILRAFRDRRQYPIVPVLESEPTLIGSDIAPQPGWPAVHVDWLAELADVVLCLPRGTGIVTNPPYGLAAQFIRTAVRRRIAGWWLLRLNWLGSDGSRTKRPPKSPRFDLWRHLSHVLVLVPRPSFAMPNPSRRTGQTDATEYAWMYFEPVPLTRAPQIGWARKPDGARQEGRFGAQASGNTQDEVLGK